MEPPRKEMTRLLRMGLDRGELPPNLDLDMTLAVLVGPIMYWQFFCGDPQRIHARSPRTLSRRSGAPSVYVA